MRETGTCEGVWSLTERERERENERRSTVNLNLLINLEHVYNGSTIRFSSLSTMSKHVQGYKNTTLLQTCEHT